MKILSCIFVIIGVLIGAGFASGKEIYSFFFIYGEKGIIGIVISVVLISYTIYKTLKIIKKYDINSYRELLQKIINKKTKIDMELVLDIIVNVFLLTSFFIMCAGFSAYFKQEFGINEIYSSIAISVFSYIVLNKDIKGIFLLNSILIPIMIIFLGIMGIKSFENIGTFQENIDTSMWIPKAILYASYNCITLISMLIPMKKYIENKKDILKISAAVGIIILVLAIIILLILLNIDLEISNIELPAIYASRTFWKRV